MKAKDTVMDLNQLAEEEEKRLPDRISFLNIARDQAEISFKAGQEEEGNSWLMKTDPQKARCAFTRDIILRVRSQAFKEVVEWIESKRRTELAMLYFWKTEWPAKLKEWGL